MTTPHHVATVVELPTALTIRTVNDTYGMIHQAFDGAQAIKIKIPEGASMDISFIQLVVSAYQTAEARNLPFEVLHPADGGFNTLLEETGFPPMFQ